MPELSVSSRRRALRRKVNTSLTLAVESDISEISGGAFALDLSELGARVRSQIRLQPGQMITIVPSGGTGPKVRSQVIWVTDEGANCSAGIAFLQPIDANAFTAEARI